MLKKEKPKIVESLAKKLQEAKSLSFIDFTGMDMKSQQSLKRELKAIKGTFLIAKNTLLKLASISAKLPKELTSNDVFKGQTAVVLGSTDPVAPIQAIGKFSKDTNIPQFKAGVVGGVFQDKQSLLVISKLPSKEVLVGQTVGSIASPMYALISNLQGTIQELLGTLSAKVTVG